MTAFLFGSENENMNNPINDIRSKIRHDHFADTTEQMWDFVVVGGGIVGAETFRALSNAGAKTLLIDAADFASGTSSHSGMLIWGGLLYLKQGDVGAVLEFSKARNKMTKNDPQNAKPLPVQYVRQNKSLPVSFGFSIYSILGGKNPEFPMAETDFAEKVLLEETYKYAYKTEEALLQTSDARYVLDILFSNQKQTAKAFNYFELLNGSFENNFWTLHGNDKVTGQNKILRTRYLVNCAGPGTEIVHSRLGNIKSPFKHVWSKGAYLCLSLPSELQSMLVIDMPKEKDVITYCPLARTALWGPTENKVDDLSAGYELNGEDIKWLAQKYFDCTGQKLTRNQIVSHRCGVRPLVVASDYSKDEYTLNISRTSRVHHFADKNLSTFYGGKFTGSADVANQFLKHLQLPIDDNQKSVPGPWKNQLNYRFENESVISPKWSLENEMCWNIDDYLRRRTPLHQIVFNGGFGINFENEAALVDIAKQLSPDESPLGAIAKYRNQQLTIDNLLKESI